MSPAIFEVGKQVRFRSGYPGHRRVDFEECPLLTRLSLTGQGARSQTYQANTLETFIALQRRHDLPDRPGRVIVGQWHQPAAGVQTLLSVENVAVIKLAKTAFLRHAMDAEKSAF